jgi:predicted transcriptional regulator
MIKRIALLLVLFAALAAASAARSQQPAGKSSSSTRPRTVEDSVKFRPSPELQKSLDELAASVQALAHRIASDPQIRSDAMRVASGLVTTTQRVVAEQSVVIQDALKTAADRIAAAQSVQHQPSKKQ